MDTEREPGADGNADSDRGGGPRTETWCPIVDLTPARGATGRARVAAQIREACEGSGFFLVTSHGIPGELTGRVQQAALELFRGPGRAEPQLAADPADPLRRGLLAGTVEPVAAFTVCGMGEPGVRPQLAEDVNPALSLPNRWPPIPGFTDTFREYLAAVRELADRLMRLCAISLGVAEDWFDPCFAPDMSELVANHYPATAEPLRGPDGGLLKIPHRDWGTLTILHRPQDAAGLEVLCGDRIWREVPLVPDSFVVNVGDLMALWTNDRWRSSVHRVVAPPADRPAGDRLSIAYFHQPGPEAVISCVPGCADPDARPRHPDVRADAYFAGKRRKALIADRLVASGRQQP